MEKLRIQAELFDAANGEPAAPAQTVRECTAKHELLL